MKALFTLILLFPALVFAKDVTLQWDHDGDCNQYKIYRSQQSSHWPETVGVVDCPTTQFTDVNVPRGTLSWVVTAVKDVESNASNAVELAYYYALVKFDYDNGRILYKGENADIAALTSDTDWVITKYYYNASGAISEMRVRTTSWDNRAVGW